MNRTSRVAMICLAAGALGSARTAHADDCRRIRAEINLTTGTIDGNFGLDGTVAFVADPRGTPPATAPAVSNVFSGILTITTERGVLQMRETGMLSSRTGNPAGTILASWGDGPSGTGCYADVVGGDLFFNGRIIEGQFLVDVRGELCEQ
jgi:hypothetical protein